MLLLSSSRVESSTSKRPWEDSLETGEVKANAAFDLSRKPQLDESPGKKMSGRKKKCKR